MASGRLTGPDLKDVLQRKDRAWLTRFMQNPKAMVEAGDPYALQLQQEARGVIMPTLPGVTPTRANELLNYIEAESKGAKPQTAGPTLSDRPFTAQDAALGRDLFLGTRPLRNGGPACAGCHRLGTTGRLGGGTLGPDLTRVYEQLGGRQALEAWLSSPPTPTMQAIFNARTLQPDDVAPLLAAFEDAAKEGPAPEGPSAGFLLLGFGGMALALVGLQVGWRNRFRAVRRPLVGSRKRGDA